MTDVIGAGGTSTSRERREEEDSEEEGAEAGTGGSSPQRGDRKSGNSLSVSRACLDHVEVYPPSLLQGSARSSEGLRFPSHSRIVIDTTIA